jgi:hypothetical protein
MLSGKDELFTFVADPLKSTLKKDHWQTLSA